MRRSRFAFAFALCLSALSSLVSGCPASENVLLLEVRTQADVDTLEIIAIDGMGRRAGELNVNVDRTRDDINNGEPIRVVVPVGSGGAITVFLRAESPAGAGAVSMLATRCYTVSGVVRDDVLLVQIDASLDADGDGFPFQSSVTCRDLGAGGMPVACDVGMCPDETAADCDDADPGRFPGNDTICMDEIDQNCRNDGLPPPDDDEPCSDQDGDDWTACGPGAVAGTCDCADDNPLRNPDIVENETTLCNDMIDQDCNSTDALCDLDGDGFPANQVTGGAPDCDDTNEAINPDAAEVCDDRIDNNCNLLVDEGRDCAPDDLDRDGSLRCPTTGTPDCSTCDCNDCNGAIRPGATEICDGLNQITGVALAPTGDMFPDCPGDTDGDGQVAPRDCNVTDRLAYTGAPENCMSPELESCFASSVCAGTDGDGDNYVAGVGQDCDDANPMVGPAAAEACDGVDNDCDGVVNELTSADVNVGCVFDPVSCGGDTACRVDFVAATGDLRHCGGCGLACNPDATNTVANACDGGVCDCNFEPGLGACATTDTCCGGANPGCSNLDTDHDNCGGCGTVCGAPNTANPECVGGSCICAASGGVCGAATPNCCGSGCVDLTNDPNNCGRCGHSCGANATCSSGTCSCTNPDTFDCDGDLNSAVLVSNGCEARIDTPTQCGGCGASCFASQVSGATCDGTPGARRCTVTGCNTLFANCDGAASNGCETDLRTTSNCGACGTVCNPAQATAACDVAGTTAACGYGTCNAGFESCDGNDGNGCERSTRTLTDCGGCGVACALAGGTETCASGTCAVGTCDAGLGNCDTVASNGCETALNSLTNCGGCGTACNLTNATESCATGTCTITACSGGFDDCNGSAGDGCERSTTTLTDCGGCGVTCNLANAAETCPGGTCTLGACVAGFDNCDSVSSTGCEANIWMNNACGTTCAGRINCTDRPNTTGGTCASGTCSVTCSGGFLDCAGGPSNGCETAIWTDTSCGTVCAAGSRLNCTDRANTSGGSCASGTCNITCDPGFLDCSGGPSNGCETDIWADNSCGTVCAAGSRINCTNRPNTTGGTCGSGTCTIMCSAGFADCNGNPADGCEADLTARSSCRACGTVCTGTDMCCPTGAACRPTCG